MTAATDAELLAKARAGSEDALSELLDRLEDGVLDYLDRRTGPRVRRFVSVSDLRQETLLRAAGILRQLPSDASVADFKALLCRNAEWMIKNAARDLGRLDGESALAGRSADVAGSRVPTPSGEAGANDELDWLESLFEKLAPEAARILRLRLAERTFKEIAAELEISEDAARKRHTVATERLRALMQRPEAGD